MTTDDLILYIQKQIEKNIDKELIIARLVQAGWKNEDIDEGFNLVGEKIKRIDNSTKVGEVKTPDIYREPLTEVKQAPTTSMYQPVEIPKVEASLPEISSGVFKEEKKEEPKVWTPMAVKVIEPIVPMKQEELASVETTKEEKEATLTDMPIEKVKDKLEEKVDNPKEEIKKEEKVEVEAKKEELMPTLINKTLVEEIEDHHKPVLSAASFNPYKNETEGTSYKIPITVNIPKPPTRTESEQKIATPIQNPVTNFNLTNTTRGIIDQRETHPKKNIFKWILVVVAILLLGVGAYLVFGGSIQTSLGNVSIVRKDPKGLIVDSSSVFENFKSYKFETNIRLSSPSFANITTGLANGETNNSTDRDFILLKTKGLVNRNSISSLASYDLNLSSSLFSSSVLATLAYDGVNSYVSLSGLKNILGVNTPTVNNFYIPNGSMSSIIPELPDDIKNKISKINIDRVMSNIISSSLDESILYDFNDFIKNTNTIEKAEEKVGDMDTYHYEITSDRINTKKFLKSISDNWGLSSLENKNYLDESIGSITIDSFDVWVGKSDNNIYQYKFSLSIPLSKIVGLNDKGIGNDKVTLDLITTYSDFDVTNSIEIPSNYPHVDTLVKNIHDIRIKREVGSFKEFARRLFNQEGSYGKKSNTTGSCINPNPSSLFSPSGHTKQASQTVGDIANNMNNILNLTSGVGSCYSTSTEWAIAVPLASDSSLLYCADSKGAAISSNIQPVNSICQ